MTAASFFARLALLACTVPALATAGEFTVNPIRLELGAQARSGVIAVRNESKARQSFQLQAMEWTQDADGKDTYVETQDLVFLPRLMSVEPGEEGVIRVGARVPAVAREKTYRLFIEELPGAPAEGQRGGQLNVLIRFGAPVFVVPSQPQDALELESLDVSRGEVRLLAHNSGNRHQVVESIRLKGSDAQGREVFALTLADRYLLAGARKRYTAAMTAEQCRQLASLAVEFQTNRGVRNRQLAVTGGMCP